MTPVGLSDFGGRVSAVEKGGIGKGSFNHTATHEIGHLLGLQHSDGGLMFRNVNSAMNVSQRERGEIINGGYGQITHKTGNGTYRQSTRLHNYKTNIQSQVRSFMSKNNIK